MRTPMGTTLFLTIFLISVSTTFSTGCFDSDSSDNDLIRYVQIENLNVQRDPNSYNVMVNFYIFNANSEAVSVKYKITIQAETKLLDTTTVAGMYRLFVEQSVSGGTGAGTVRVVIIEVNPA